MKTLKRSFLFFLNSLILMLVVTFFLSLSKFFLYLTPQENSLPSLLKGGGVFLTLLKSLSFEFSIVFSVGVFYFIFLFFRIDRISKLLFLLPFIISCIDFAYFDETGKHITFEYSNGGQNFTEFIYNFLFRHEYRTFFYIVYIFISFFIIINLNFFKKKSFSLKEKGLGFLFYLIVLPLPLRGGIQKIPLTRYDLSSFGSSEMNNLGFVPSFYLSRYLLDGKTADIPLVKPVKEAEFVNKVNYFYFFQNEEPFKKDEKNNSSPIFLKSQTQFKNIVVILLESWTASLMHKYNPLAPMTTPFFETLAKKSFTPNYILTDARRTSSGTFSTICSYPNPLGVSLINSNYSALEYFCYSHFLKQKGFETTFVQGTFKNTSSMDSLIQVLGFDHSYGKEDLEKTINKNKQNYWGFYDDEIYSFSLEKIKESQKPFFFVINTNTTHDEQVPPGEIPHFGFESREQKFFSTLYSADQSLKRFFEKMELLNKWNDTALIIVSDHAGPFHQIQTPHGFYTIPGLIYLKNHKLMKVKAPQVASNRDLMTTTLLKAFPFLNPPLLMGEDLTKEKKLPLSFFDNGFLYTIKNSDLISAPYDTKYEDQLQCFDIKDNFFLLNEKKCSKINNENYNHDFSLNYIIYKALVDGETTVLLEKTKRLKGLNHQ